MQDGEVLSASPDTIIGYTRLEVGGAPERRPWRCAGMNLFRSEEHARNWREFDPQFTASLQPLAHWVELFSEDRFRARGAPDYISRRAAGTL